MTIVINLYFNVLITNISLCIYQNKRFFMYISKLKIKIKILDNKEFGA